MSIPDAWTTDRVDFNGKARVVKLVTGIKDVGNAKVKNLSKSNSSGTHANHKSRSQKVLQLKAKHFSDKPVVRTNGQDDRPLTTKPPICPGAYFMPSENPTATLLTQINVGTNRLTDTQVDYLESVQTKSTSTPRRGVPMVDVGCGGFFAAGVPNDIIMTKRAFISDSQSRERKQIALRKSQSMAIRPITNVEPVAKPQSFVNGLNTAVPVAAPNKSLCYHESFKRGGDHEFYKRGGDHESFKRGGDFLPVYDKSELDACNDQIDLLLPGVVSDSTPRRSSQSGPVVHSRTPNGCSCCSMCDGEPGDFRFMIPGATPTLNRKSTRAGSNNGVVVAPQHQCECKQCHDENGMPAKKLVQYRHGDVIKTFDWLESDSQETAL